MAYRQIILICFLVQLLNITQVANSFVSNYSNVNAAYATRTSHRIPSLHLSASKRDMNFKEMQEAAKDPASWEAYVLKNNSKETETEKAPPEKPTNGKGYVPIEVWDRERKKDDMSWEERVQFEGQRNGNRSNQNEILRKNLNGW